MHFVHCVLNVIKVKWFRSTCHEGNFRCKISMFRFSVIVYFTLDCASRFFQRNIVGSWRTLLNTMLGLALPYWSYRSAFKCDNMQTRSVWNFNRTYIMTDTQNLQNVYNILNVKSHQRTTNKNNKAVTDSKTPLLVCCAVGLCPSIFLVPYWRQCPTAHHTSKDVFLISDCFIILNIEDNIFILTCSH